MKLKEAYPAAHLAEFKNRVHIALCEEAFGLLQTIDPDTDPDYPQKLLFCRHVLDGNKNTTIFATKSLTKLNIHNKKLDSEIRTAVTNNFLYWTLMYKPELLDEGTG